ncbi:rhodanese-like domain-containing protein [Halobacterium litoreum]|uniref:Rhodanese-like domain-containing protein n=1 Tax=Halobacterium litoreum TaxID=2039234 RepID=A0ABD5NBS2_9EURY|nr:rhodanese-like domain-containing protein [Halobacterium litoreum]UHH14392.1 rhodanese-like domain-containing protein [Halobacterium litoreum]
MTDRTTRRHLLAAVGAGTVTALAGCSSSGGDAESPENSTAQSTTQSTTTESNATTTQQTQSAAEGPRNGDDLPADPKPKDGYPPEFDATFEERSVDPSSFETTTRNGIEVSLVPIDVAYYWFVRGEARFADTRSATEYEQSHVLGAVNSPAGDGEEDPDDPVLEWAKDERIVTYCACPHHLSTLRAASLQEKGYETVYAIDEGYTEWQKRSYPMAGDQPAEQPEVWTISGKASQSAAGETAWAYHTNSNQKEATTISEDGSYELHLKFVDVTGDSEIRVETPGYTVTDTLDALTGGSVSAEGTVVSGNQSSALGALGF